MHEPLKHRTDLGKKLFFDCLGTKFFASQKTVVTDVKNSLYSGQKIDQNWKSIYQNFKKIHGNILLLNICDYEWYILYITSKQ